MHAHHEEHLTAAPSPAAAPEETARAAAGLVAEMTANRLGTMSPSVYETARLVSGAPWLDGHGARCAFLLRTQRPDGWWGRPDGYDVVPTLSAVEALLRELDRPHRDPPRPPTASLARAALSGLWVLADRLAATSPNTVPDTIAAELIIPWLVDELNDRLAGTHGRLGATTLGLPRGIDRQPLRRLRAAVAAGHAPPEKIWHTLEALGEHAADAPGVRIVASAVGSSPAATAAYLAGHPRRRALGSPLRRTQARWGGPVPGVISIAVFERAWVLGWLLEAGVPVTVPEALLHHLAGSLTSSGGAPAGPGLPADADDTAVVLHTLALAGRPAPVHPLWAYENESHFDCFPAERTPSTSTNAHVLEALLDDPPPGEQMVERARRRSAITKVGNWLLTQQHTDGSWDDKWHASPYYATMCCAQALSRGHHSGAGEALARAAEWTRASQRADGSWGRFEGTAEETSYALQTLLRAHPGRLPPQVARAVSDGRDFLLATFREGDTFPPLWHDKDLYAPLTVLKAARLAALGATAARLRRGPPASSARPGPQRTEGTAHR